jgi:hypothetical protein
MKVFQSQLALGLLSLGAYIIITHSAIAQSDRHAQAHALPSIATGSRVEPAILIDAFADYTAFTAKIVVTDWRVANALMRQLNGHGGHLKPTTDIQSPAVSTQKNGAIVGEKK